MLENNIVLDFIDEDEVLKIFNKVFTKTSLYNACRYQKLPYYKNGRRKFYKQTDILNWIDTKKIERENISNKNEIYCW